ncbi:SbcC/MukB-like Walker B domain-containing protein [Reyranella sp. CPCC 100927]|uniref:SbcC/MukB-like Walker B domain-containing protein n=1 Tax=Reyranella sp. CPCC 100927 TaxID=2599616 RepID=UPI0011B43D46|nr:SbcC/MukB-like Walker B domain-containing protein [Reyranella sp. CPCC 100927]TWS99843.1 AAA family ATPase [Reyranella sp. CPCC 100927]
MIELRRIVLVDWYLFRAEQIDLAGMTALIGPNGAGKSAIIDAVQTVLSGANMMSIRFNPSAQSGSKSKRSIRDYCLGVVSLDERGERSQPTRENAYTYVILGFVDVDSGAAVNLGIAFSATEGRGEERCEARFLVRGGLISLDDLLEPVDDGDVETRHWHAVRTMLRAREAEVIDDFGSATEFVEESLRTLSPPGFPLDPRRFIKAFRNALLLRPVENPTEFVRNYVLDEQPIKVARLRQSIELYRFLTGKIETLKAQTASLGQIQRIAGRVIENERAIHVGEWQIARMQWETFRREVRSLQVRLGQLRHEAQVKEAQAVAAAARLSRVDLELARVELTHKSSEGEQLALMYESDKNLAINERESALAPLKLVESLVQRVDTLAERRVIAGWDDTLHGLLSAVTLAHRPVELHKWGKELAEGWEEKATQLDGALSAVTVERLVDVQKRAGDNLFTAQKEVRDIQDRMQLIDRNLQRIDSGQGTIERGTEALLLALRREGIVGIPLCDLVEVKDQKWRVAVEAVLGRSREALIVEPEYAVRALDTYRRGTEEDFRQAEIINTTKTAQTRPADKGSLATVLSTDNPHARAFLNFRLGRLAMVETMEKMASSEGAITADRMMQSGRTVKRLSHPGILKLGRANDEETRKLLKEERAALMIRLGDKVATARHLQDDSTLISDVARGFEELRSRKVCCAAVGRMLVEFDAKITRLANHVEEARRSGDPKLLKRLENLKDQAASARREKADSDRVWREADAAKNQLIGDYNKATRDHEQLRSRRRSGARLLRGYDGEASKFELVVRAMTLDRLSEEIQVRNDDVRRRAGDRRQSLQRELTSALFRHCQQFAVSLPFTEEDAKADVVGTWAGGERQRLESHELVKYEEQCKSAVSEMTTAFRDDLLHRLHDAFEGIRETLNELNRHLKDRQFHGRDYYTFRSSHDPAHADLIELVKESRRPDFQLPLFSHEKPVGSDTPMLRAMRRIEEILADPQAKTDEIEDPRKYFTFELYIHDEAGRVRSSLSSRAGTGSGGEGQLPFYIAIGASLAATYQNRRTGQSGLALAVFDEAFNRLDTKAIGACSEFMRSLGLQVIVATPDEKRHIFMEVADTVVNVNRTGNVVLVDNEYLTEKTHQALASVDPYRKGFDIFKAELIAASTKADIDDTRREAAE